jgi:hypothetical protein
MGLLVQRAAELSKLRDFGLQNVANMLWATCFLRIHSEETSQSVCDAISDSLLSIDAEAILSGVGVCVCVCVCRETEKERERGRERFCNSRSHSLLSIQGEERTPGYFLGY